jgi:hypothetical protein
MVDILGADHKLISSQLCTALRLIGVREPEIVIFEFVSLPTGSMSTRRGKFISADELLDEVEKQAFEEVSLRRPEESEDFRREVARQVAIGAVRYDVVKVSADKPPPSIGSRLWTSEALCRSFSIRMLEPAAFCAKPVNQGHSTPICSRERTRWP